MFVKVPSLRHIVGGCNTLAPNTFAGEVFYQHQEHPVLTTSRTTKLHPYKCYYHKPTMEMVLPTMETGSWRLKRDKFSVIDKHCNDILVHLIVAK